MASVGVGDVAWIALVVGLLAAVPAVAGEMRRKRRVTSSSARLFNYSCFEGTRGTAACARWLGGRLHPVPGQRADALRGAAGRYAAGEGERFCASLRGLPIQPCFNLERTSSPASAARSPASALPIAISRGIGRSWCTVAPGALGLRCAAALGYRRRRIAEFRALLIQSSARPFACRRRAARREQQALIEPADPTSTTPRPMNDSARKMPVRSAMSTRNTLATVRKTTAAEASRAGCERSRKPAPAALRRRQARPRSRCIARHRSSRLA